jgi:hypothetical protein
LPKKSEPDFVILKMDKNKKHCYIIELKIGYMFDTKKTKGERELIKKFEDRIAKKIQYTTQFNICCFFETDKTKICEGLKNDFNTEEVMTGEELCQLLEIDYNEIVKATFNENDMEDNLNYFVDELLKIKKIKNLVEKKLKKS